MRRSRGGSGIELRLEGVDLHRGARQVLCNIDWRIAPGERWILSGHNGSGKTQLLKLCAGAVWPDPDGRGRIAYHAASGRRLDLTEVLPRIAYVGPERQDRYERHGWNFTVQEVVGTGCTHSEIPQGPLVARILRQVKDILKSLGIARLATRRFLTLSYGERRLVLVARAVAMRPALLLLDETFGGLDTVNRARLTRWLARASNRVPAWVLATHRREETPSSATHFLEIEGGVVRRSGPILRRRQDRSAVKSARARTVEFKSSSHPPRPMSTRESTLIEFEQADVYLDHVRILRDLNFGVRRGECWVVHGGNGAGKSTLLRAIYGDHPVALGGQLRRRGIVPGVPLAEFRRWCALVAPHLQSDPPRGETVLDTIVSGLRRTIGLDGAATPSEQNRARRMARAFGLEQDLPRSLTDLSYGQVRRVLFARAFVAQPRLLLLDEALGGIDVETREVLRKRIDDFVVDGGAVVLSSHHTDEWPDSTAFELELRRGRVVYRGAPRDRAG